MTTPPNLLLEKLYDCEADTIDLRTVEGKLDSRISLADAIALSIRGEVEGVGGRGGTIRYLRILPLSARLEKAASEDEPAVSPKGSRSTAITRNSLGVYRQPLHAVEVHGEVRVVVRETSDIIGYCYAFCGSRL